MAHIEKTDAEWIGRALVKLLNNSPVDGTDKFLRLLQEWNRPSEVLELINALTLSGVAVTITQRFSYLAGKENKANNLKKARAAKVARIKEGSITLEQARNAARVAKNMRNKK